MAEIETIYTGLKYSKTILKFYNEKKGTYEKLIGGKGFFSFAKPSPVAINFVLSFDPCSTYNASYRFEPQSACL